MNIPFCKDIWEICKKMLIVDFELYRLRCEVCNPSIYKWREVSDIRPIRCPFNENHTVLYYYTEDVITSKNRILIIKNKQIADVEFEIVKI